MAGVLAGERCSSSSWLVPLPQDNKGKRGRSYSRGGCRWPQVRLHAEACSMAMRASTCKHQWALFENTSTYPCRLACDRLHIDTPPTHGSVVKWRFGMQLAAAAAHPMKSQAAVTEVPSAAALHAVSVQKRPCPSACTCM